MNAARDTEYSRRVAALIAEGMTNSDAQAIADHEGCDDTEELPPVVTCPHCGDDKLGANSTVARRMMVEGWELNEAGVPVPNEYGDDTVFWETDEADDTYHCRGCDALDVPVADLLVNGEKQLAALAAEVDAPLIEGRAAIAAEKAPVDVLAVMDAADRIEILRDEIAECHARINGAGRTTSAESVTASRERVVAARREIREARRSLRGARAAVAELIEAARQADRDFFDPSGQRKVKASTRLAAALARIGGTP